MSAKCMLLFLIGAYLLIVIHTLIINEDEVNAYGEYLYLTHHNDCKHHLSEESALLYDTETNADNEEIRIYQFCVAQLFGYWKNGKIMIDTILADVQRFVKNVSPPVLLAGQFLLRICETEARIEDNDIDTFWTFFCCIRDRVQTDV